VSTGDVKAPGSRPGRALLLGAFGLLVGVVGAFGVDRFDDRIRSKSGAEGALGVPILVEVPRIPRSDRGRILAGPQSSFIEAFRGLRPMVDRWGQSAVNGDGHRLIVVSSPTGREGTTTTVAHLAAVLGETGRMVLAMSADLRHPRLHVYFDRPREPGLTDVLRGAPDVRHLTDLNLATTIRGVRFVSSGAPVRNPSPLLEHLGGHLRAARSLGDVVLVDGPPLLPTSDGAEVARHADGVLLVVRAGHTSVGAAARSAELLRRLNIPLIGAVLVASERPPART
jgi:Mrp family chromosome partitioning ATPase